MKGPAAIVQSRRRLRTATPSPDVALVGVTDLLVDAVDTLASGAAV